MASYETSWIRKKGIMSIFDLDDIAEPKIPWGKNAGTKLCNLDNDYLLWLLEKAESNSLKPTYLNQQVITEWKRRRENPTTS